MSDVKRLLAEAIQRLRNEATREVCRDCYGTRIVNGHRPEHHGQVVDLDLAIEVLHAIRLPDYEAAVEALERLLDAVKHYTEPNDGLQHAEKEAGAALARLRDTVPA